MNDEMKRVVICKHCRQPEYYGEMRWLNGFCGCRRCYKAKWQDENHRLYTWDDLDKTSYPTLEDYAKQIMKDLDYVKKHGPVGGINKDDLERLLFKVQSKICSGSNQLDSLPLEVSL